MTRLHRIYWNFPWRYPKMEALYVFILGNIILLSEILDLWDEILHFQVSRLDREADGCWTGRIAMKKNSYYMILHSMLNIIYSISILYHYIVSIFYIIWYSHYLQGTPLYGSWGHSWVDVESTTLVAVEAGDAIDLDQRLGREHAMIMCWAWLERICWYDLVGGLEHDFYFSMRIVFIPIDFHIFRGVGQPPISNRW